MPARRQPSQTTTTHLNPPPRHGYDTRSRNSQVSTRDPPAEGNREDPVRGKTSSTPTNDTQPPSSSGGLDLLAEVSPKDTRPFSSCSGLDLLAEVASWSPARRAKFEREERERARRYDLEREKFCWRRDALNEAHLLLLAEEVEGEGTVR
jgi:hypothetical protein